MQWSQIKTLFILCFLILDVYLLTQFILKQQSADYEVLSEQQELTIKDNLASENITISADLPEENLKGSYISVKQQLFSDEDSSMVKAVESQETAIIDKEFIVSRLEKSVTIQDDATDEATAALVKSELKFISPDSYVLWDWNKELNVLIFFQEKNNRPIYFNQNGIILVFLNDKNEISFYTQTLLGEVEEQQSLESLTKAVQAINVLYQKDELNADTEVTKVDIGFHTRILADGPQVFAPTWKISINGKRNYFVNALEGYIFSSNDIEFLYESIAAILIKVNTIDNNPDLKEYLLNQLTNRLEAINRSESE